MAASPEEIRVGLAEILFEIAGTKAEDVQLDKSFAEDLEIDSLCLVEVVIAAEDRFGVQISDDYVKGLSTVGDAVAYVLRAAAAAVVTA
jgi:acyl carrier protein